MVVAIASAQASAQQPKPPAVTDAQVDAAIRKGVAYLYGCQAPDGGWDTRYKLQHPGGAESLIVLAALQAGEKPDSKNLAKALESIAKAQPQTTYARAARALVYARLGKPFAEKLADDATWLARQQNAMGGWGYGPSHPTTQNQPKWTDNSNTQWALYALDQAAVAGASVPQVVWRNAQNYWVKAQNTDGGWGYEPPAGPTTPLRKSSYGSTSAAGAAALLAIEDHLPAESTTAPAKPADAPRSAGLAKALAWMDTNFQAKTMPLWLWGASDISTDYYYVYLQCAVRAAQGAGMRNFGATDWYPELAATLVARQRADGSWGDPEGAAPGPDDAKDAPVRTALAVLALAQARTPVLVNRLAAETDGGGRQETSAAVNYAAGSLQWNVTWQTLPASAAAQAYAEAPLLLISAATDTLKKLPPEQTQRLAQYVREGGVVVVSPIAGKKETADAAAEFFKPLLPELPAAELPADHPIYSAHEKVDPFKRPRIVGLGDGTRTSVFILPFDAQAAWASEKPGESAAYALAANLAAYACDNTCPQGRLKFRRPVAGPALKNFIRLARVRHSGDWATCPAASARLGETLAAAVNVGIKEEPAVALDADVPADLPLLWMTGSRSFDMPAAAHRDRLKKYLAAGGTLLVDSAAGRKEFADSAAKMLADMFGADALKALPDDHPLLTGKFSDLGSNVTKVTYTPAALAEKSDLKKPSLQGIEINGRLAVIFSPYGLSGPSSGVPIYGCRGLATPDARKLALNVILFASQGK